MCLIACICVVCGVLLGCDVFKGECEVVNKQWCDGSDVKVCAVDEGSGYSSNNYVMTQETCAEDERCVEWPILPDMQGAWCIAKDACATGGSLCIGTFVAATCVDGQDVPAIDYCGDENHEGEWCQMTSFGATCTFSNQPCSPDGIQKCGDDARYSLRCAGGYWTELDSCLVGEDCVDTLDGGVDCALRAKQ